MTARSALARHGCLASACQRIFDSETQDPEIDFVIQLARISRDSRAVPGTPDLDMPGPLGAHIPRYLSSYVAVSFSFSPFPPCLLAGANGLFVVGRLRDGCDAG
jgi:hypothetical protein